MSALQQARTGYSPVAAPIRTPRATEYDIFARVTARMKAAIDNRARNFAALVEALHDNRRLWTVLASDVADPGNALPADLRARIFYLAEFTLQHSDKVLAGRAQADVLVEINTAIMRGLRQQAAAA